MQSARPRGFWQTACQNPWHSGMQRKTLLVRWKAHPGPVMQAKDGAHEVRQRMVSKVRGHICHAQPLAWRQRHSLQETQSPSALQKHSRTGDRPHSSRVGCTPSVTIQSKVSPGSEW